MIKVLLIDCNQNLYDKLTSVRQEEVNFIGLVTDESVILKDVAQKKPDIILLCTTMENNVNMLVGMLKETASKMKVIYVFQSYSEELIIDGIENNVDGYLLERHEPEKVITEIVNVSKGQYVFSGEIAKTLINEIQTRHLYKKQLLKTKLKDLGFDIKDRYIDILFLILRRHKNNEIANKLNLSEKTIRDYVSHIYNLVDIHNRKALIIFLEKLMRD